ncbi:MAG: hypothetical protein ACRD3C_20495 [Vicinamibacterales bacterium]
MWTGPVESSRLTASFRAAFCATAACAGAAVVTATEPRASTLEAFERYVDATEARMETERDRATPFLWVDRLHADTREQVYARLQPIVNDIPKRVFTFMLEATRRHLTS